VVKCLLEQNLYVEMNSKNDLLSESDIVELVEQIKSLRKDIINLKIKFAYDDFKDTSLLQKKRRQIARIMTQINSNSI